MHEHLSVTYRLPDGRVVKHLFHYLFTGEDGMTTWQVDPNNEEIDMCRAQFVMMDWEDDEE